MRYHERGIMAWHLLALWGMGRGMRLAGKGTVTPVHRARRRSDVVHATAASTNGWADGAHHYTAGVSMKRKSAQTRSTSSALGFAAPYGLWIRIADVFAVTYCW